MLLKLNVVYLAIIFCESANIGLGNGRSSEETSSLKTEVSKYKTSDCGDFSSEERNYNNRNKKHKNRNKEDSDESESSESEDDDRKQNKNRRRNNNSRRQNYNGRSYQNDHEMEYSSSFFDNRNFGMRPPQDDYFSRPPTPDRDSDQNRWDSQNTNRNPYQNNPRLPDRGTQYPFPSNMDDTGDSFHLNNQNRGQDPYQANPRPYNRNNYPYPNRDEERFSNRDNWNRRQSHRNNWSDSSEDERDNRRYNNRRQGQRRTNRRNGSNNRRKNSKKNSDENECVSQCVFNNMQIMEDDGIPSEAGMIQWAQNKIKNDKLKQNAVKEIRRCFGTLASSDGDNSCNFSKSLSSCLKLDLDDNDDD